MNGKRGTPKLGSYIPKHVRVSVRWDSFLSVYYVPLNHFLEWQLWMVGECFTLGGQWSLVKESHFQGTGDNRRKTA